MNYYVETVLRSVFEHHQIALKNLYFSNYHISGLNTQLKLEVQDEI